MSAGLEKMSQAIEEDAQRLEELAVRFLASARWIRDGVIPPKPDAERVVHLAEATALATGQAFTLLNKADAWVFEIAMLTRKPEG